MSFVNISGGIRDEERDRSQNDYYPTPPFATYALLKSDDVPEQVIEPAAGRGWMAYELQRSGRGVQASDLYEYPNPIIEGIQHDRNFLDVKKSFHNEAIGVVTNPPYAKNMAQNFVEHALETDHRYVAILARTMFVESEKRYSFFKKYPPSSIHHFSSRFSCFEEYFFTKPLSGMVGYSWFVWDYRRGVTPWNAIRTLWINSKTMHSDWLKSISTEELERLRSMVLTQPEEPDVLADFSHLFQLMGEPS